MSRKKPDHLSFDYVTRAIEELLEKLESQDTSLEDALSGYETGVNLIRQAQAMLTEAEQKVRKLSERDGKILEESFELNEDDE